MKHTGVTRHIDSLGRVVIPKEIRKNLKIRNNDELLIDVLNENIVLSKYAKFSEDDVLKSLVNSISKIIKKDVLITNKDKVIVSNEDKYKNSELSNSIINKINEGKNISSLIITKVNLFNEFLDKAYLIYPFSISYNVVGSIMLLTDDLIDNNCLTVMNVLKTFLEDYLEE